MIRCALCGCWLSRSSMCSDLALLVVHWMEQHRAEWIRMHPDVEELLP